MANINALKKLAQSTPLSEYFAGIPADTVVGSIPFVGPAISAAPYFAGLASMPDNSQKGIGMSFLPGVSSFRRGNRIKTQVMRELAQIEKDKKNKDARPVAHAIAEHIGPTTSLLTSAGIGAGLGALLAQSKRDIPGVAGGGALAGVGVAGVATLIGMLAAAIKRRRTKQEQIDADKGSLLMKYLVPGTAAYDYHKRLGRSQGERDEAEDEKKNKENKNG